MGGVDLSRYIWPDVDQGRQPQELVELDYSDPLNAGVVACIVGDSLLSVGPKQDVSLVGNITKGVGKSGRGLTGSYQASNNYGKIARSPSLGYTDEVTFECLIEVKSFQTSAFPYISGVMGQWQYETGGHRWGPVLRFNADATIGNAAVPVFGFQQGGTSKEIVGVACPTNTPLHLIGTYKSGSLDLYINGQRFTNSGVTGSFDNDPLNFISLLSDYVNSNTDHNRCLNGTMFFARVYDRWLSPLEVAARFDQRWQFSAPLDIGWPVSAAGGGTLNASAAGLAQAAGTASLAAQIALAAVGISTANGSAAASTSIPLSAAGLSVSAGTANAQATITISAAGVAQAAGQAGLSASLLLAGAGSAVAAGNAVLAAQLLTSAIGAAQASGNASLAAQINALAAGAALSSGSADMAAQLNALASGAAQPGGTANLAGGAAGSINAAGAGQATGIAALSVTVVINAAGSSQSSGTAILSGGAPGNISASGNAQAAGSAALSATVDISAAGFVQAMGAGQLVIEIPLTAFGGAVASGSAHLIDAGGSLILTRAPSGAGPSIIHPGSVRPQQSATSRPSRTGGRRY